VSWDGQRGEVQRVEMVHGTSGKRNCRRVGCYNRLNWPWLTTPHQQELPGDLPEGEREIDLLVRADRDLRDDRVGEVDLEYAVPRSASGRCTRSTPLSPGAGGRDVAEQHRIRGIQHPADLKVVGVPCRPSTAGRRTDRRADRVGEVEHVDPQGTTCIPVTPSKTIRAYRRASAPRPQPACAVTPARPHERTPPAPPPTQHGAAFHRYLMALLLISAGYRAS